MFDESRQDGEKRCSAPGTVRLVSVWWRKDEAGDFGTELRAGFEYSGVHFWFVLVRIELDGPAAAVPFVIDLSLQKTTGESKRAHGVCVAKFEHVLE